MAADKLIFKKGLYASLPANKTSGAVYFTTDTNEIYFDTLNAATSTVERRRVQDVLTYATLNDVQSNYPTSAAAANVENRLIYVADDNILMTWHQGSWVQVNAQQTANDILQLIKQFNQTIIPESGDKRVLITSTLGESGAGKEPLTSTFGIASASSNVNITQSVDAGISYVNIAVDAVDQYVEQTETAVSAGEDDNSAVITTTSKSYKIKPGEGNTVDLEEDTSSYKTKTTKVNITGSGKLISLNTENNNIKINTGLTASYGATADGKIKLELTGISPGENDNDSTIVSKSIQPIIKLSKNATEDTSGYTFQGDIANDEILTVTLPVYTKSEVDQEIQNKLEAANAMTFMGSVSISADSHYKAGEHGNILPTESVKIGDTYKVVEAGSYYLNKDKSAGAQSANIGDLFIATSSTGLEEGKTTSDQPIIDPSHVLWVYIPSGDETQYTLHYYQRPDSENGVISLGVNKSDSAYGVIRGDNKWISIGEGSGETTAIINHKDVNVTETTSVIENNATFVTGLTREQNHITGIQYGTLNKTFFAPTQVKTDMATSGGSASYILSEVYGTGEGAKTFEHTLTFISQSLKIAPTDDNSSIGIELEWGSF